MSEERDIREKAHRLNFLKKKIHVPYQSLEYWLTIPEFVNAISEKVCNGETIDDRVVYESISEIYNEKEKVKWTNEAGTFNYRLANAAVKRLRKVLGLNVIHTLAQESAVDNSTEVPK